MKKSIEEKEDEDFDIYWKKCKALWKEKKKKPKVPGIIKFNPNPMKHKFEKAIENYTETAYRSVGENCNHTAYVLSKDFKKIAETCNTLHQQAMKETRAKDRETVKGLLQKICELERKLIK